MQQFLKTKISKIIFAKAIILPLIAVALVIVALPVWAGGEDPPPSGPAQCADGADNDGDGRIDLNDPGCTSVSDNSEVNGNHNLNADWFVSSLTLPNIAINNDVTPGSTYRLSIQGRNTGDGPAPLAVFGVTPKNLSSITPGSALTNPFSSPSSNSRGYAAGTTGCVPAALSNAADFHPCWFWSYNNLQGGANPTQMAFEFTVNSDAAPGSQICFVPYAAWNQSSTGSTSNGANPGTQGCVTVEGSQAPRHPYLATGWGSLHAGVASWDDEPCLSAGSGSIQGQSGSKADYIVSAGGSISNFGSGGTAGTNNLTLESYGQICRADLAKRYLQDDALPQSAHLSQSSYSVDDTDSGSVLPDGMSWKEGNLVISGGTLRAGHRKTVIVHGNVHITGNITAIKSNYSDVDDIPSLGIITTGNINIHPQVTALYGIFYAGSALSGSAEGIINTCQDDNTVTPSPAITNGQAAQCDNNLTVEGAMVAIDVYFRRSGGDSGGAAAEEVSYLPQLLLRPPLGLGGITEQL